MQKDIKDFKTQRSGRQRDLKKTTGFLSKTTTLYVHYTLTLFVHFFALFAWLRRENACFRVLRWCYTRRFATTILAQHSIATFLSRCFEQLPHFSNIATLTYVLSRKSSLRIVSRNTTLMDYVNRQRRNWFLFLNLNMVPGNSTPGGFGWIWQSKWVGAIAIKTGRTQIHFLSDVLVEVASLDLNVDDFDSESRIKCQWLTDKHACESHSQLETAVKIPKSSGRP